jgi:hypothetical protein
MRRLDDSLRRIDHGDHRLQRANALLLRGKALLGLRLDALSSRNGFAVVAWGAYKWLTSVHTQVVIARPS